MCVTTWRSAPRSGAASGLARGWRGHEPRRPGRRRRTRGGPHGRSALRVQLKASRAVLVGAAQPSDAEASRGDVAAFRDAGGAIWLRPSAKDLVGGRTKYFKARAPGQAQGCRGRTLSRRPPSDREGIPRSPDRIELPPPRRAAATSKARRSRVASPGCAERGALPQCRARRSSRGTPVSATLREPEARMPNQPGTTACGAGVPGGDRRRRHLRRPSSTVNRKALWDDAPGGAASFVLLLARSVASPHRASPRLAGILAARNGGANQRVRGAGTGAPADENPIEALQSRRSSVARRSASARRTARAVDGGTHPRRHGPARLQRVKAKAARLQYV